MIPEKFRAPKEILFRKPHSQVSSLHFRAKIFSNNLGYNRFAAVVGAKADKSSVKRHFWKRLVMNAALREKGAGKDVLIIANPNLSGVSKKEAKEELEMILKKIN